MKNTRKKDRVHCNLEIVINESVRCKAFDICEGGLYVYTDQSLSPRSAVRACILSKGKTIEVMCRVKHSHEGIGLGLMFIDLDEKLKVKIRQLIDDISRQN